MYPVWFTLGWIDVPSYTALMVLAFGAGLALAWIKARRAGLSQMDVLDVALVAVLAGVVAARAVYVAVNWDYFGVRLNEAVQVWQGGLSWYGGWAGGVIGGVAASAWRRLDARAVFDVLAPGLVAGAAFGWIGCHLAGVAYGREVFPGDRWWSLAADLPDIYNLWNPRFPTQMWGAAWASVCFIAALVSEGRVTRVASLLPSGVPGIRFAMTMALYSTGMFVLGLARGDAAPMIGAWRASQVMDAGIVVAGIAYVLVAAMDSKEDESNVFSDD